MPLEAQDAWVRYMTLFGDHSLRLSEVIELGYSYIEAKAIFTEALDANEPIDMKILQLKVCARTP